MILETLVTLTLVTGAYERPNSWKDYDRDGQNTREEILVERCVVKDKQAKEIPEASCQDIYSGERYAFGAARRFQVDHVYPASEAWKRRTWKDENGRTCKVTKGCREYIAFFNDMQNLALTTQRTNARKNDRMPDQWCPTLRGARFLLAKRFRATVAKYSLPLTASEKAGLDAWTAGTCYPGAVELGGLR